MGDFFDKHEKLGWFIIILIILLFVGMCVYGNVEQDLHGHYEYVDMQGNRGISQHCRKYDYKKYGLECDTENGIQQVQAFKYIRD
jgi:hypothetical protein